VFYAYWHGISEVYVDLYFANEMTYLDQRRIRMQTLFRDVAGREITAEEGEALYDQYFEYYITHRRLYDDVLPCLDALADRPLGVISNGDGEQQRRKLADVSLLDRFDPVVVSGDIRMAKPDPGIFLHACALVGADPGSCVYVGDRLRTDAHGALAAGVHGVWLNRTGVAVADSDRQGITEIASLSEFPRIVAQRLGARG
jgi:putative hydrolase of the HAD superfamily